MYLEIFSPLGRITIIYNFYTIKPWGVYLNSDIEEGNNFILIKTHFSLHRQAFSSLGKRGEIRCSFSEG